MVFQSDSWLCDWLLESPVDKKAFYNVALSILQLIHGVCTALVIPAAFLTHSFQKVIMSSMAISEITIEGNMLHLTPTPPSDFQSFQLTKPKHTVYITNSRMKKVGPSVCVTEFDSSVTLHH